MKLAAFVIPTFKEKQEIETLIKSFSYIDSSNIDIIIANGNPSDDTSRWLMTCGDKRIIELTGDPSLYWSGLVNLGLRYILNSQEKPLYVFIMNADIQFSTNILSAFISASNGLQPCQLAAVTFGDGKIFTSGVKVRSWFFTINRHPLAGEPISDLPMNQLIPVDYLPTRCIMFPFAALAKAGLTKEKLLPHYGGDHEYTARLSRLGFKAYIVTDVHIELDSYHTRSVYCKKTNILDRISTMFSKTSPSNPLYNIFFVWFVYPWYARPSALFLYFARSMSEIFLGGTLIKKILTILNQIFLVFKRSTVLISKNKIH